MLLFYVQELPNFPSIRHPHQLYVHFTREAPINLKINGYGMYGDDINITMGYRKDGNVFCPYFYMKPMDYHKYKPRIPLIEKRKSIAWMVSNCRPDSGRDLYVKELQKHIDIDVYGRCGNYTCDDTQTCFRMFEKTYKFYLAFENNICLDYYTEKLGNPLRHEIVPIVFGGANYTGDFPEHSLINVVDYPSPRDLAKYLNAITEDEFYEYFQWKSSYYPYHPPEHCLLCEFLHNSAYTRGEQILPPSYGRNYTKWWHETCHNDLIYKLKETGGW